MFEVGKMYKNGYGCVVKVVEINQDEHNIGIRYPIKAEVVSNSKDWNVENTSTYTIDGIYCLDNTSGKSNLDLLPGEVNEEDNPIITELKLGDTIPAGAIIAENAAINMASCIPLQQETTAVIRKAKIKARKLQSTSILSTVVNNLDKIENKIELRAILAYLNIYYGE